jgi:hypothetical protein
MSGRGRRVQFGRSKWKKSLNRGELELFREAARIRKQMSKNPFKRNKRCPWQIIKMIKSKGV